MVSGFPTMSDNVTRDSGIVTLQMIADAAGVSRSTVSRGLKNHPRIGEKTARRIQKLADDMGYCRDAHLTDLMIRLRKRKHVMERPVIAMLFWQNFAVKLENSGVTGGLWQRARECGYQPEAFNLTEFQDKRRIARILYSRGIDGVILCPAQVPSPLPDLPWRHFSVVAVGHSIFSHSLHRCANNHFDRMRMCVERLIALGYKRIGAALTTAVDRRTHGFYHAAYLLEQKTRQDATLVPLLHGRGLREEDEKSFYHWFDQWTPEVIICGSTVEFVHECLKKRGLKVPRNVGLVDMNYPSKAGYSGVLQNGFETGVAAVDLLITLMQANEKGLPKIPRDIFVGGTWINGTSTKEIK